VSSSEDRDSFIAIEEDDGTIEFIAFKNGDIVIDITEWEWGNPAEDSTSTVARYVMSREDFFRLMEWMKGLV
jgi:hypothetical protein